MSYTPPKTIIEAKIRMLHGNRFEHSDFLIYYSDVYSDFMAENAYDISLLKIMQDLIDNVQNWLQYKEPEPEFPFKFDELVCIRNEFNEANEWRCAKYSHTSDDRFGFIGGIYFNQITTFSHDLLGKVVEPTTPVWIVKEGKPCVKS